MRFINWKCLIREAFSKSFINKVISLHDPFSVLNHFLVGMINRI